MNKITFLLTFFLSLALPGLAQEETEDDRITLSGSCAEDITIGPGVVYVIEGNFSTEAGVTLTILPGADIRFSDGSSLVLEGPLVANGTPQNPIRFSMVESGETTDSWDDTENPVCVTDFYSSTEEPACISYARFQGLNCFHENFRFDHCDFRGYTCTSRLFTNCQLSFCNISGNKQTLVTSTDELIDPAYDSNTTYTHCNIVNQDVEPLSVTAVQGCNIIRNGIESWGFTAYYYSDQEDIYQPELPSYFGADDVDAFHQIVLDGQAEQALGLGTIDTDHVLFSPQTDCPAIVSRMTIDGKGCTTVPQIGIGHHQVVAEFSRHMDTSIQPSLSHLWGNDRMVMVTTGAWNAEGTAYTFDWNLIPLFTPDGSVSLAVIDAVDDQGMLLPIDDSHEILVSADDQKATCVGGEGLPGCGRLWWDAMDSWYEEPVTGYRVYQVPDLMVTDLRQLRLLTPQPLDAQQHEFLAYGLTPGQYHYFIVMALTANNEYASSLITLTPLDALLGDVNGDGRVNVADVTALVDIILGKRDNTNGMADINGDTQIDIADVTSLVNIILNQGVE